MNIIRPIVVLFLIMVSAIVGEAAVRTWDGGGSDANWTTAANWVGDIAPVANDDLVFPATSAQFTTNNNLISGLSRSKAVPIQLEEISFGSQPV